MTKQHFEAFAREIKNSQYTSDEKAAAAAIVIRVARQFNPRFDAFRFEKAAGFEGTKGK